MAQNIQTGNLPQGQVQGQGPGQEQASPRGGRGGLNAQARQFIPHGNKRARDDVADSVDSSNGKRARGGGGGN